MKFIALPTTAITNLISQAKIIVSSRVSVLPWLYWPYPFYLGPPQKILNLSAPPPPSFWATHLKILENFTPPLKCTLVQKSKTHFVKKQNILIPTMKWEHIWKMKYKYTVAKSKNQKRVRLLLGILFLLGS